MFRRMDDDGSKNLGYDEFRKGIDETGLEISEDGFKEMFAKFDKDGSGKLSIDEFLYSIRVIPDKPSLSLDFIHLFNSHPCLMLEKESLAKLLPSLIRLGMAK